MREFVITTESNSDLSTEYLMDNQIGVIPHYFTVEDEVYGDGKEMSTKEFYDCMRQGKKAATMASNPAVIEEMFTNYAKEGKDILHISFSSALSGGYSNVSIGAREVCEAYPGMKAIVIDTLTASLGEGILIMKAVEMKKAGKSIDEVAGWMEEHTKNLCVQFTVDDLNHLYRGGRLSKTTAVIGTLVNIKPILYIDESGKLVPLGKTRGRKKSLSMLVDNMDERVGSFREQQSVIGIVHGDCKEDAEYLAELVEKRFGYSNILIRPIGPSIGAHSGPGAIGLIFMGDNR